jgi:hypothetical protein
MNNGNVRQWRDQARSLTNDAQDLRRQLQASGVAARDLVPVDDAIRALREADSNKMATDPRSVQALTAAALEKIKKFDLDLRKRLDTSNSQLFLSGAEDAPKAYQPLVNDYFRALSNGKKPAAPAPATPPASNKGGGK